MRPCWSRGCRGALPCHSLGSLVRGTRRHWKMHLLAKGGGGRVCVTLVGKVKHQCSNTLLAEAREGSSGSCNRLIKLMGLYSCADPHTQLVKSQCCRYLQMLTATRHSAGTTSSSSSSRAPTVRGYPPTPPVPAAHTDRV
jgi:hypothetical protein